MTSNHLKVGDRVCMEPGIPDPNSKATLLGMYNLDPAVRFWATPPVHGVLRPTVVHPAAFTFKLPDNVSFAEGAMVEPLAVGMQAATKAKIKPGDVAIVMGAGPIGMVTALAALAGGCSQVIMTDVQQPKLDLAATLGPITPVNVAKENLKAVVDDLTEGWGVNLVFECSGNERAAAGVFAPLCPGGAVVYRGHPAPAHRLRRGGGHGEGGARRACLPLCPRLPARHCAHGQRQAGCEAAHHRHASPLPRAWLPSTLPSTCRPRRSRRRLICRYSTWCELRAAC